MMMRIAAVICAIASGIAFIAEHPIKFFVLGLGALVFSVWSVPSNSRSEQGKRS